MKIVIRRGKIKDIPYVRKLAVESVVYGIPSTRKVDPRLVQQHTVESLSDLEFSIYSNNFELIVAEDVEARKLAGYLMLDLDQVEGSTGEKQSLIHDLAVEKEYWGKFVVDLLMAEAEVITKKKNLMYIVGEVSTNNRRALIYATRRLGYTTERHQIVKVLG